MEPWYRRYGSWIFWGAFCLLFSAAGAWLLWAAGERQGGKLVTLAGVPSLRRDASRRPAPAVTGGQVSQRLQRAGATMGGDLEVSLIWDGLSDFDLEVQGPSGERIHAEHWQGSDGGVQDVDANPTLVDSTGQLRVLAGQPPGADTLQPLPEFLVDLDEKLPGGFPKITESDRKAPAHFSRHPVEHIYYEHAPRGTYLVRVHCYSWRERSRTPLAYTVQARSHGKVFYERTSTLGPESYAVEGVPPITACQLRLP